MLLEISGNYSLIAKKLAFEWSILYFKISDFIHKKCRYTLSDGIAYKIRQKTINFGINENWE